MTTAHLRQGWLAGALLTLAVLVGLGGVLASGILTPPPDRAPVAIATGAPATAPVSPPLAPSSTATRSPAPAAGVVATRITIERLGIDLPIYEGDGYTAKLGRVAHFPTTSWPGGGSLVYLYAHARDHNFIALWDARVGDRIDLELRNGATATYVVSLIDDQVAWDDLSVLDPTPRELLRLQTCNSYEETAPRFIVEAVPVKTSS